MKTKAICIDCGKELSRHQFKRCRDCYFLSRKREPEKCIDCGKPLRWQGTKRCKACNSKFYSGKNNPCWRGGKPKCIDCGKPTDNYGSKRCHACYLRKINLWTESEIQLLKRFYPLMPAKELAVKLNRPIEQIRGMASMLKIKANRRTHYRDNWYFLTANPYRDRLSETEIAYIAGIVDGEGDLGKWGGDFWSLGVTNTYKPLLLYLQQKVPYSKFHFYKAIGNRKDAGGWALYGNFKIRALLELLLPYLTVKRAKAEEALTDIKKEIEHLEI